ncbi:MAG: hypothetical protein U0359_21600 [Byssovorax sp.]
MSLPFHLPYVILALVFLYLLPEAAKIYKRRRGMLLRRCPETNADVLVQLGRGPASHDKDMVTDCSHWPARQGCAQRCVSAGAGRPCDGEDASPSTRGGPLGPTRPAGAHG